MAGGRIVSADMDVPAPARIAAARITASIPRSRRGGHKSANDAGGALAVVRRRDRLPDPAPVTRRTGLPGVAMHLTDLGFGGAFRLG